MLWYHFGEGLRCVVKFCAVRLLHRVVLLNQLHLEKLRDIGLPSYHLFATSYMGVAVAFLQNLVSLRVCAA